MSSEPVTPSGMPVPTATYRLQMRREFDFDALAQQADYLSELGVSHVYLSPILQATPGSTHGYDVVDHSRVSEDLGGPEAFARLRTALGSEQLGVIVDVVPNHMAVPTPADLNATLWSVLREGPASPYAAWFDVDWSVPSHALLMPVLGQRIGACLDAGEITLDRSGSAAVLRYYDHVFPVRPGTEALPLTELLDQQWYRLAYWRVADEELNYRRFFDVDTLAGVRVEDERVFAETHALLIALLLEGGIDGLRIDHPDGLADPGSYLRRLAEATGGAWVVVEKILEGAEALPEDWPCAGTTGYDALLRVGGVLCDPAGTQPLTTLYAQLTGEPEYFDDVVEQAKRYVIEHALYAEVHRLVEVAAGVCESDIRLRDHSRRALREALVEMLVAFPVYRAYVVPGEPVPERSVAVLEQCAATARSRLPEERHATVDLIRDLALGRFGRDVRRDEFVVRFQQTCGPVMAKGVEDTAFYRWFRYTGANEVGGDPSHLSVSPEEFHSWCSDRQRDWPLAMTTLSTHDTKRSEDVRARLAVLTELPGAWADAVTTWRAAAAHLRSADGWPDPNTEYLLWQTLVGAWPIDADRLTAYLEKATREAKRHTTWTEPDADYDKAVRSYAEGVLADSSLRESVAAFVEQLAPAFRSNVLAQKLVQLTMPGVPDVYQGTELVDLSLVDPDNRRPVDYAARREALARLDETGDPPAGTSGVLPRLDEEKLFVVSRVLRLRRDRPDAFGADAAYSPVTTSTEHALAFRRGEDVVAVATRLPVGLERRGGWQPDDALQLRPGRWVDVVSGAAHDGGRLALGDVLADLPAALLVRN